MKKFNLFKEIIITDKNTLADAIAREKKFTIDIYGNIDFTPSQSKNPLIYRGVTKSMQNITEALGKNYQVVVDADRVLIKAFSNWQELIKINTPTASYDDTTADGVAEFSNRKLEEIGWHATEFNIDYRTLVEVLEENCEGTVLCIEQEEPYQFSGLGFLSDNAHARRVMYDFCRGKAKELMEHNPDFAPDKLTDDEEEAAEFFGLLQR